MSDKIRKISVLQINANNFGKGGISTTIFRLMENSDDAGIEFAFLSEKNITDEYLQKIQMHGGKIEKIPATSNKFNRNWLKYKYLKAVLRNNSYDIVHINGDNALAIWPYIFAARSYKNCKIAVHAHTTKFRSNITLITYIKESINKLLREKILQDIDLKIACSHEAARFMFSVQDRKNVYIMKNGLIPEQYRFVQEKRTEIRANMNVGNKMVIGHIGRFTYAKNHEFLIDLFWSMKKSRNDIELWLIGDGELENDLKKIVHEYDLDEDVRFLGVKNNIQCYLCGMDVMVFPSRYEGLPLVLVEAQANDLPIVCSDVISSDTFFSDNVTKCSLSWSYGAWIDAIEGCFGRKRRDMVCETTRAGFNMKDIADGMGNLYASILN